MTLSVLVPPLNFAMVAPGVYRSGHPNSRNFAFMVGLKLRTVVYLSGDDYASENMEFLDETNITVYHIKMEQSKEPFGEVDDAQVKFALELILDKRKHPILLHCNKGKHRVGCVIGVLRRFQNWSFSCLVDEYLRFTGGKTKIADQEFMETFDLPLDLDDDYLPDWMKSDDDE